ncbi:DUF4349 domain-containing protein [Candidatus Woesearchaeota archaeon]|nr:DUF4349 domain-containing protein [Candidatus Woesearchaeota archaeon]
MNKYLKWSLIAFAIFAVLFAVGCTKSVLEEEQSVKNVAIGRAGVAESRPAIAPMPPVEVELMYDESYDTGYAEPAMYRKYYPDYEEPYGSGEDIEVELKIIRNAYMSIEVEDYFLASQKAEAYAKKYGGYVSNSDARADYNNRRSGTVTIRVPEIHFDAVIAELSLLGEIKSKNTDGSDVTEQYVDLQARINNSKAHEARLVKMYQNATNVNEMMNVERELSRVRGDIERMQGQLRYMDNRVEMTTITVELHEPAPVVKKWGILDSFKNALEHSLSTLRWMIELIGWLLPLAVVGVLLGLLIRWRVRRNRNLAIRKK